jgi:hypothetical protein
VFGLTGLRQPVLDISLSPGFGSSLKLSLQQAALVGSGVNQAGGGFLAYNPDGLR